MLRNSTLLAGCTLLLAGSLAAHAADEVLFDPDGPGPEAAVEVGVFDWLPGSALAKGALPLAVAPATSSSTQLSQARLGRLLGKSGAALDGTGLNSAYEITLVGGAGELGSQVGFGISSFTLDPASKTNFFEIYWDPGRDADPLAGRGFNNGTLILAGVVADEPPHLISTLPGIHLLDQSGGDDWSGQLSAGVAGTSVVAIDVLYADPRFFPDPGRRPKTVSVTTAIAAPVVQTDPSRGFVSAPGGSPEVVPSLGMINGFSGPDFEFQFDAEMSMSLEDAVPGACRAVGGGVVVEGALADAEAGQLASGQSGQRRYLFGGRVAASKPGKLQFAGQWRHQQTEGPDGSFVFRVGAAVAPLDTFVVALSCGEQGLCEANGASPSKALDWSGVGAFEKADGTLAALVNSEQDQMPGYSRHFVRVHVEDLGKSAPGGRQPTPEGCPLTPAGSQDKALACSRCPDLYEIEIHANVNPGSPVIYSASGFVDAGNLTILENRTRP